ncbi:hypothetical protein QJS66_04465 [Kocuria rhizophila]|nr:hypothetical protein QJS66_04465 [Kocuria rhizophila]
MSLLLTGCGFLRLDWWREWSEPAPAGRPAVTFETPMKVGGDADQGPQGGRRVRDRRRGDACSRPRCKGSDGSSLGDTCRRGRRSVLTVNDQLGVPAAVSSALSNAQEGEVIAYSSPDTSGKAEDGDDSTSVEVYRGDQEAAAAPQRGDEDPAKGMPKVTQDDEGTPTIQKPSGPEPTKLATDVLIEGDGETVWPAAPVVANYVGGALQSKPFDCCEGRPRSFPWTT